MMMVHFYHIIFPWIYSLRELQRRLNQLTNTYSVKRNSLYFVSDFLHWYTEIGEKEGEETHDASLVNCAEYSSFGVNKWRTFAEWPVLVTYIMA